MELTPSTAPLGRRASETDSSMQPAYGSSDSPTGRGIELQRAGSTRAEASWRSVLTLGLGMGLVAALSAGTAWWLMGGPEATEAAGPTAVEPTSATTEPLWQEIERRTRPPPPDRPSLHEESRDDASPREPAPNRGSRDEPVAAPANPTDSVLPVVSEPPPRKAKPVPKVLLKVRGGMGLDRAQVKIASRTVTVGDRREVLISAGRKTLKWRAHEHDTWKPGGSWRFEPGTTVMAFVTKTGLKLRTLP